MTSLLEPRGDLSTGVVLYLSPVPIGSLRGRERLRARYGLDAGEALFEVVRGLLDEAQEIWLAMPRTGVALNDADTIVAALKSRHPELTSEAATQLRNEFAYSLDH